jgi:hypothetical protein
MVCVASEERARTLASVDGGDLIEVTLAACTSDVAAIQTVLLMVCKEHVHQIFTVPSEVAVLTTSRVCYVVAGALFARKGVVAFDYTLAALLIVLTKILLLLREASGEQFFLLCQVCFFAELLVTNAVCLVPEIGAENTIGTSRTVADERAVAAITRIEGKLCPVAVV